MNERQAFAKHIALSQPKPQTLEEAKKHPIYVMQRHLGVRQMLFAARKRSRSKRGRRNRDQKTRIVDDGTDIPLDERIQSHIEGYIKGEPFYPRSLVHTLRMYPNMDCLRDYE